MTRTLSSTLTKLALSAVAVAGLFGLSACGGTDEPTTTPTTSQSQAAPTSASAAPTTAAPTTAAPTTAAPTPAESASSDSDDDSDDSGEKPDRDDVAEGLVTYYQEAQGMDKETATKFATCIADEMYDKATVKTLESMEDGNLSRLDPADSQLLATATMNCAKKIAQ